MLVKKMNTTVGNVESNSLININVCAAALYTKRAVVKIVSELVA